DDEEDVAHGSASSADGAFALMFSAVAGEGRESGEFGGGLVGDGADLGHLGEEAGYGAAGDALDGAEGAVEFAPQRVLVDEGRDLLGQGVDLPVEDSEQ